MAAIVPLIADHRGNANDPIWREKAKRSLQRQVGIGALGAVHFEQHGPLAVAFAEAPPFTCDDFYTCPIETRAEAEALAR